jgi:hypothetical protein
MSCLDVEALEDLAAELQAGHRACIYEGALSFVTTICSSNGESPYKMRMGRQNDKRPSSKPRRPR